MTIGFSYIGYEHQIISSVNYHGSDTGGNYLKSAEPLGIKPGPLVNRYSNVGSGSLVVKAKDLIISGGDLVYNVQPSKMRAGDVYIHGGQIFKNEINSIGFLAAKNNLNSGAGPAQEYANYGHIFLASKNNDIGYQAGTGKVTKAVNVYVGYQSDITNGTTQVWNDNSTQWSPKGDAALNVVAAPYDINRDPSLFTAEQNKAINIQLGDIVTYNQPAGWRTINLLDYVFAIHAKTVNKNHRNISFYIKRNIFSIRVNIRK
jgi:hypothetical protein